MGMYATINGQDIKFSGLLALAYADLFYNKEIGNHVEVTGEEIALLIGEMVRLFYATPMTCDPTPGNVNARIMDLKKLALLAEYAADGPRGLIFA